ncbi:hypothetical protein FRC08_005573 [Ceratobasidium sp. 394]|nr:hypothetical protein FRC08_005573 [Ceratobasidium sp. 394]KAG9096585.1 hypothetical protein FS749_008163 [Ceratobasidium sp. UAMH 11750]
MDVGVLAIGGLAESAGHKGRGEPAVDEDDVGASGERMGVDNVDVRVGVAGDQVM